MAPRARLNGPAGQALTSAFPMTPLSHALSSLVILASLGLSEPQHLNLQHPQRCMMPVTRPPERLGLV